LPSIAPAVISAIIPDGLGAAAKKRLVTGISPDVDGPVDIEFLNRRSYPEAHVAIGSDCHSAHPIGPQVEISRLIGGQPAIQPIHAHKDSIRCRITGGGVYNVHIGGCSCLSDGQLATGVIDAHPELFPRRVVHIIIIGTPWARVIIGVVPFGSVPLQHLPRGGPHGVKFQGCCIAAVTREIGTVHGNGQWLPARVTAGIGSQHLSGSLGAIIYPDGISELSCRTGSKILGKNGGIAGAVVHTGDGLIGFGLHLELAQVGTRNFAYAYFARVEIKV